MKQWDIDLGMDTDSACIGVAIAGGYCLFVSIWQVFVSIVDVS